MGYGGKDCGTDWEGTELVAGFGDGKGGCCDGACGKGGEEE